MNRYDLPKDTYSSSRFEELQFAVAHYGTEMHRGLFDMLVDAGLSKRQIFTKYMKVLRETSAVNHDILRCVGVGNFLIKPVDKQTKTK